MDCRAVLWVVMEVRKPGGRVAVGTREASSNTGETQT